MNLKMGELNWGSTDLLIKKGSVWEEEKHIVA